MDDLRTLLDLPMPDVPDGGLVRQLQARMARFSNPPEHAERRSAVLAVLERLPPAQLRAASFQLSLQRLPAAGPLEVMATLARYVPVTVLLTALGLDPALLPAVAGFSEAVAGNGSSPSNPLATLEIAQLSVLFQAYDATAALIAGVLLAGGLDNCLAERPPVLLTRRQRDGQPADVPMTAAPFGLGRHACPGQRQALAIAEGVLAALTCRSFRLTEHSPELAERPNLRLPLRLNGVLE